LPLELAAVAELWDSRFGIPVEAFSGYRFFKKANSIWAISDVELPRLSYEAIGMRIMNCKDRPWKPTTAALQVFGKYAARNLVHLDADSARIFLGGKSQEVGEAAAMECEPGYVVVFYRGEVLGCGLYSHGLLVSQIPKERRLASRGE
jgi:NOL1/NOP2/fmu family ribosome biogenesis protein